MKKKRLKGVLCLLLAVSMLVTQIPNLEILAKESEVVETEDVQTEASQVAPTAENELLEEQVIQEETQDTNVQGEGEFEEAPQEEQKEEVESSPVESIPEESAPVEAVPEESAPEEPIPEESAPAEPTPEESTPVESVPEEVTPENEIPDENPIQQEEPQNPNLSEEGTMPEEESPQDPNETTESVPEEPVQTEDVPAASEKNIEALIYKEEQKEEERIEVKTGASVLLKAGLTLSGENSDLNGGVMEIVLPKQYIEGKPHMSEATSFTQEPVISEDSEAYKITCYLENLPTGSSVIAPLDFKTRNFSTPDFSEIKVTVNIKENNEVVAAKTLTIVNRAKCKLDTGASDKDTVDKYRPDNPTHTPENVADCPVSQGRVSFANWSHLGEGIYGPKKVKVVVTLADITYFDPNREENKDWVYNEQTRQLERTFQYSHNLNSTQWANFIYQLPGVEYEKTYTAFTVYAVALDENDQEIEGSKSEVSEGTTTIKRTDPPKEVWRVYCDTTNCSKSTPYFYHSKYKDQITQWESVLYNQSIWSDKPEDFTGENPWIWVSNIRRNTWDEDLFLYSLTISSEGLKVPEEYKERLNHNTLYYYQENGQKKVVEKNLNLDETFFVPDKDNAGNPIYYNNGFCLEFDERIPLFSVESSEGLRIKYETKMIPERWESWKEDTIKLNSKKYCMYDGKVYKDEVTEETENVNCYRDFVRVSSGGTVHPFLKKDYYDGNGNTIYMQNIVRLEAKIEPEGAPVIEDDRSYLLKNGKAYIILPNGWEYVDGKTYTPTASYYDLAGKEQEVDFPDVEVINDFQRTGKQALVFDLSKLGDLGYSLNLNTGLVFNEIYFDFYVKPTYAAKKGESKFEFYVSYENIDGYNAYVPHVYSGEPDVYDLNKNGSVEDEIPYHSCSLQLEPNQEVYGYKTIGKDWNRMNSNGLSGAEEAEPFYYGLTIGNLTLNNPVRSLSMLDVLPYQNDWNICAEKDGTYGKRGSEYAVSIQEPVQLLKDGGLVDPETAGYEVFYSTDAPVADLAVNLASCTLSQTEVTDWSNVTMFRIEMTDGTEIAKDQEVTFVAKASIPEGQAVRNQDVSYNTFCFAQSANKNQEFKTENYIETNKVSVPVLIPTIEGTIYRDFNFDTFLTKEEVQLENIPVQLLDDAGKVVKETTTDENGHYEFTRLEQNKNYKVKVGSIPDTMTFTDGSVSKDKIFPQYKTSSEKVQVNGRNVGNHVNGNGESELTVLNEKESLEIIDVALTDRLQEIAVEKRWTLKEGTTQIPLNEVEVELKAGQESTKMTLSSDSDWKGSFQQVRIVDKENKVISYDLKELTEINRFYTDITFENNQFVVTNVEGERPSKNLQISKEVTGKMGDKKKAFHFTITLKDQNGNGFTGDVPYIGAVKNGVQNVEKPKDGTLSFQEGTAQVTLSHGQSIVLQKIPTNFTYSVEETEANQDGYTTTYNGGENALTGKVENTSEDTIDIDVVNQRETIPTTGLFLNDTGLFVGIAVLLIGLVGFGTLSFLRRRRGMKG